MGGDEAPGARFRRTLDELRQIRERRASLNAIDEDRRRVDEAMREERRDARATTIHGRRVVERRRHRSDIELRAQREEQMREWFARQGLPAPRSRLG